MKESTGLLADRLGQIDSKVGAVLDYFKDSRWRERERLGRPSFVVRSLTPTPRS